MTSFPTSLPITEILLPENPPATSLYELSSTSRRKSSTTSFLNSPPIMDIIPLETPPEAAFLELSFSSSNIGPSRRKSASGRRSTRASPIPRSSLTELEAIFAKPKLVKTAFRAIHVGVLKEFCQVRGIEVDPLCKGLKADFEQAIRCAHQKKLGTGDLNVLISSPAEIVQAPTSEKPVVAGETAKMVVDAPESIPPSALMPRNALREHTSIPAQEFHPQTPRHDSMTVAVEEPSLDAEPIDTVQSSCRASNSSTNPERPCADFCGQAFR